MDYVKYRPVKNDFEGDVVVHVDYAEHRSGHHLPRRERRRPRGLCRTSSGCIVVLVDDVVVHVGYVEHRQVMIDLHIESIN